MTISVAICTYNGAKYIREQLESILDQELGVDEIVLCDDGSDDETIDIVCSIAENNPGVEWNIQINSPNLGVTKNFEKAIGLCNGDIIFLSDQDDVWRKDKTKMIVEYLDKHPTINVVFTDASLIDSNGKLLTNHSLLDSVCLIPNMKYWKQLMFEILAQCNRATGATMALRRSFIPIFSPMIVHKWCLHDEQITMAACQNRCLGVIEEKLIYYRQHGKNVIGVPIDNWVYTSGNCPDMLDIIVKPCELKPYSLRYKNLRMVLYCKRFLFGDSWFNKLKLTLLLPLYWYCYGRYWWRFYRYDIWRI